MRNLLYILLFSSSILMGQVPSSDQNYIKTSVYKEPTSTMNDDKAKVSVTYYDGLGRPIQQIAGKASSEGKDIITHIEYDGFGRQVKDYLPYAAGTSNLTFDGSALSNTFGFYSDNNNVDETTSYPYAEKRIEASPLGRLLKQSGPGDAWAIATSPNDNNDRSIKFEYLSNTEGEVKKLMAYSNWNGNSGLYETSITDVGHYPANVLYKTVTKDENWISGIDGVSEEFKNKSGQVVLKRSYDSSRSFDPRHDTYYIYDQFGNLSFVLPPICNGTVSTIDTYGYQYKYDSRNRLVEKKLPGNEWQYIVYDNQDRVVATGPALSPFGGTSTGWLVTNYDDFGRIAFTGWFPQANISTTLRNSLQSNTISTVKMANTIYSIDNIAVYYTHVNKPIYPGMKLLTVNYYDNYRWLPPTLRPTSSTQIEGENVEPNAKGLSTGNWARALSTPLETFADVSYVYYDRKGRVICNQMDNYLGGYTQTDSKLDFDGTVQYTITRHKRAATDTELITREDFVYSPEDRLLTHTHKINSLITEHLTDYVYDKLGQVKGKAIGMVPGNSGEALQQVDFSYNVRGWLSGINNVVSLSGPLNSSNDLFAFKINYETPSVGDGQYNGNISETFWISSKDNVLRNYLYNYDGLYRLTNAFYRKPETDIPFASSYDEYVSYDKNGNITNLSRTGDLDNATFTINIDELSYSYNGNRLQQVTDHSNHPAGFSDTPGTTDYTYDDYGNMLSDANKNISVITYNHLNLPVEIQFGGNTNKINYLYNATGVKLKKTVTVTSPRLLVTVTDYLGSIQYTNGTLDFILTSEGYVKYTPPRQGQIQGSYNYIYQYKDHLGNIRMNYAWDTTDNVVKILDENHYYPFGLKHEKYNTEEYQFINGIPHGTTLAPRGIRNTYQYKYQEQERQDELGLNWDSFKWRNYDYAIGRFFNIDPLAEKYLYNSPFAFQENKMGLGRELEGLELSPQSYLQNETNKVVSQVKRTANDAWNYATDLVSSILSDDNFQGKPERSSKDISVSLRSKNGGGNNPTTTGSADDHWNVDGFIDAALGGAKKGNKYSTYKDAFTFVKDAISGVKKSSKATEKIQNELNKDQTAKKEEKTSSNDDYIETGYDPKTRNSTFVRKDYYEKQQKKQDENQ